MEIWPIPKFPLKVIAHKRERGQSQRKHNSFHKIKNYNAILKRKNSNTNEPIIVAKQPFIGAETVSSTLEYRRPLQKCRQRPTIPELIFT